MTVAPTGRDVLITRVFDAPRALVFKAWTDPEQLKRWHAPHGCTIPHLTTDLRPGGAFRTCIRMPDGKECWSKGIYREVAAPERLVYTLAMSDAEGNFADTPPDWMDPAWPRETLVTITFSEQDGKTTVTLHQTVDEGLARKTGAYPSWLQMLDRLAEDLAR